MSIRIVTDSTCDLPPGIIEKYGIHVVPLYINTGREGYLDGIDITREEFYTRLPDFPEHPTTAVPSIERFRAAYNTLADEGATEVVSIHISEALSGVMDVARVAARTTTSVKVTVIDSQQLSLATGFLVQTAAEMAAEGRTVSEIQVVLQSQIQRSHVFAALDTLEFLKRSGRMNKYVANFASILQIKPILTMYNGKPGTERVRTRDRAFRRLIEMLVSVGKLEKVAIVHTHASFERIAELRKMAGSLLPEGEILIEDITPVIGAHIGPGVVGFAVVTALE
ncbi:MAG: DegV family protein [Leptolinea sp.]|nr:DegV family protein [Leptolinea sp.]